MIPVHCVMIPVHMHSTSVHFFFSHFHPHANERYARADELGTPYGVTVDFSTLEEGATVTLRDRDTSQQVNDGP